MQTNRSCDVRVVYSTDYGREIARAECSACGAVDPWRYTGKIDHKEVDEGLTRLRESECPSVWKQNWFG